GCELFSILFGVQCYGWMTYFDMPASWIALAHQALPPQWRETITPMKLLFILFGFMLKVVYDKIMVNKHLVYNYAPYKGHSQMLMFLTVASTMLQNEALKIMSYPIWQILFVVFITVIVVETVCGITQR
nr:putative non-structural protein NS4a [Tamana bat virus]